jgi:hypothetical protein
VHRAAIALGHLPFSCCRSATGEPLAAGAGIVSMKSARAIYTESQPDTEWSQAVVKSNTDLEKPNRKNEPDFLEDQRFD